MGVGRCILRPPVVKVREDGGLRDVRHGRKRSLVGKTRRERQRGDVIDKKNRWAV